MKNTSATSSLPALGHVQLLAEGFRRLHFLPEVYLLLTPCNDPVARGIVRRLRGVGGLCFLAPGAWQEVEKENGPAFLLEMLDTTDEGPSAGLSRLQGFIFH